MFAPRAIDEQAVFEVVEKHDVLDATLTASIESFVAPRLVGMEDPAAGVPAVVDFFTGLATFFERDAEDHRAGLIVSTVTDLAQDDSMGDSMGELSGARFKIRLRDAYNNALTRSSAALPDSVRASRSRWLVAQTLTLGLMVRFDSQAACAAAREVAVEVGQWGAGA